MKLRILLASLAALASAAACDEPTVPRLDEALLGTYTLVEFNGKPVPAVFYERMDSRKVINSGAITLHASQTYHLVLITETIHADGSVEPWEHVENGTFRIRGTFLVTDVRDYGLFGYSGTVDGKELTISPQMFDFTYRFIRM